MDLNNQVDSAVNKVKEAANRLLGEFTVAVTGAGRFSLMRGEDKVKFDEAKKALEETPVLGVTAARHTKALDNLQACAEALKQSPASPAVNNFGLCKRDRGNPNDKTIAAFNNAVVITRRQLVTQVNFGVIITELKKVLKGVTLTVEGSIDEGLSVTTGAPPPAAATATYEALTECLEVLKTSQDTIPTLEAHIKEVLEKSKEFRSPAKVKDCAGRANLGVIDKVKAVKNTAMNMKAIGAAKSIVKTLVGTTKGALTDIEKAVKGC